MSQANSTLSSIRLPQSPLEEIKMQQRWSTASWRCQVCYNFFFFFPSYIFRRELRFRRVALLTYSNTDRYYNLTEPLLKSLFLEDVTLRYPFELSQEELRIVSHTKTPTLILGRSGTGKTTCLVFKILASYQLHTSHPGENSFRQVRVL
jgi:hypothetical protein